MFIISISTTWLETRKEVNCCSVTKWCLTLYDPWTAAHQASLSFTVSQSLFKLISIEPVMPSNHLILCSPLLLLPSIFPSIRSFYNESAFHIRWPKYRSLIFSISPSNEYSGLISFRTGWISLQSKGFSRVFSNTTVQKHQFSALSLFFWSNSHPYMTTGKTIVLTIWTFVNKVMSLLFSMLSRFVIAFLPRSKSLNFMAAVTILVRELRSFISQGN